MSGVRPYNGKLIVQSGIYLPEPSLIKTLSQTNPTPQGRAEMCYGMTFVLAKENYPPSEHGTFGDFLQRQGLPLRMYETVRIRVGSQIGKIETGIALFPGHALEGLIQDLLSATESDDKGIREMIKDGKQKWGTEHELMFTLEKNRVYTEPYLDLLTAMFLIGELGWNGQGIDHAIGIVQDLIRREDWGALQNRVNEAESIRRKFRIFPRHDKIERRYDPSNPQIEQDFRAYLEKERDRLEKEIRSKMEITLHSQEDYERAPMIKPRKMTDAELTEWFYEMMGTTPEGRTKGISTAPRDPSHWGE
ncbi:hypothetical protein J4410_01585 [Candidatus Woesearchaeota archaeon]|nr:hypothetical protein [Candidatus Woesearchaeota archaeon]